MAKADPEELWKELAAAVAAVRLNPGTVLIDNDRRLVPLIVLSFNDARLLAVAGERMLEQLQPTGSRSRRRPRKGGLAD